MGGGGVAGGCAGAGGGGEEGAVGVWSGQVVTHMADGCIEGGMRKGGRRGDMRNEKREMRNETYSPRLRSSPAVGWDLHPDTGPFRE